MIGGVCVMLLLPVLAAEPSASVTVPRLVLNGVPVSEVRIEVADPRQAQDLPLSVTGVTRIVDGKPAELPAFEGGKLTLTSDRQKRDAYFVADDGIAVRAGDQTIGFVEVRSFPGWVSLVPPVVAVLWAILFKEVITALLAGIFSGATLLYGDPFTAALRTLDTLILGELVPAEADGAVDNSHMTIILFTLMMGAMVSVMAASGASRSMLLRIERFATTRQRGQLFTWLLGFLVFFDDYANTLLVGGTMQPVSDRLGISRAKLAFLVDATSAPVAGLAIVSTWVGVEVAYVGEGLAQLNAKGDAYTLFLQTLPYRFYPLFLIAFTFLIAMTGRDFGAMRRSEREAATVERFDELAERSLAKNRKPAAAPAREPMGLALGLLPIVVLVLGLLGGMIYTGLSNIRSAGDLPSLAAAWQQTSASTLLENSEPVRMLFLASAASSAVAVLCRELLCRTLSLPAAMEAWVNGLKTILPAITVLVLAWTIARLCDPAHLNTAGYLSLVTEGSLSARWLPTIAFLLAGAVSFATGSSWSTMGLLIPPLMSVADGLDPTNVPLESTLLIATIGSVLAGAIFGDHCSPISDTTVLSSAASGCNHLEHVTTQMPYAITVAVISVLFGSIPTGFGVSPMITLPLGLLALYGIVRFFGRLPNDTIGTRQEVDVTAKAAPEAV